MRNCIILGSGRSGTSMVAGALGRVGYFMGKGLYEGDEGNPKGYFEDREINAINDELIGQVVPFRPPGFVGDRLFVSRLPRMHGWLARLPVPSRMFVTRKLERRIRSQAERTPFCLKDPRFCYTLPIWRPYLDDPVFVCVFRHPGATGHSILKHCRRDPRLRSLDLTLDQAVEVWTCMYSHVLEVHHPTGGDWIFIHYEQFLDGSICGRLDAKLSVSIDRQFADAALRRSVEADASARAMAVYLQLCDLAGYPIGHPGKTELC